MQGIFPSGSDLLDVNSVDRDADHKLLVTADDDGCVKLFRYPCVKEHAAFVVGRGHSSHVTQSRWAGSRVLSVGGNDKCLFVWDVKKG